MQYDIIKKAVYDAIHDSTCADIAFEVALAVDIPLIRRYVLELFKDAPLQVVSQNHIRISNYIDIRLWSLADSESNRQGSRRKIYFVPRERGTFDHIKKEFDFRKRGD